jgi:hypothetical protein
LHRLVVRDHLEGSVCSAPISLPKTIEEARIFRNNVRDLVVNGVGTGMCSGHATNDHDTRHTQVRAPYFSGT